MPQLLKQHSILVIIMMVTGISFFSCKGDMEAIKEIGEEGIAPTQRITNGHYTFTDSGKVRNTLEAGLLEQFLIDTNLTRVSAGFTLDIYDAKEERTGRLMASEGAYFEAARRMEAYENVIFTSPAGDSLFTNSLIWYSDSSLVYTDDAVRIVKNRTQILGKGLRAKEDFSSYTILAPIGDIAIPEGLDTDESEENQ